MKEILQYLLDFHYCLSMIISLKVIIFYFDFSDYYCPIISYSYEAVTPSCILAP